MAEDSEENGATEPVEAPEGLAAGSNDSSEVPPEGPSVAVASVAEEVEDAPDDDCPPCKGGAPAWMATFADMATLLMAFFVLILSFAQMNVPKFKEVSGSMNDSMGVQRQVPVVEPPTADNIIATQFVQAKVQATALKTISEQTTDEEQPDDPELKITTSPSATPNSSDVELVKSALREEIERGLVTVDEAVELFRFLFRLARRMRRMREIREPNLVDVWMQILCKFLQRSPMRKLKSRR